MTQATKTRRVGRRRWSALVKFLTEKMLNVSSERVQMIAAQRLTDILILREQRDQIDLRRELRMLAKAQGEQPEPDEEPEESPEQKAAAFLQRMRDREGTYAGE